MVNNSFIPIEQRAAERRMVLSYAPAAARAGLAALLALDDALGAILQGTRDPMIGQMRLTWWHGALTALDDRPAPAEPILQAVMRDVIPSVAGARLAEMIDGWEELLDPEPLDDARLERFAEHRGSGLFEAAGAVIGAVASDPLAQAGRGWALADLAGHLSDLRARERARQMAVTALQSAGARWSRPARPLGAMAALARIPNAAPPSRVARALWHRLTGR